MKEAEVLNEIALEGLYTYCLPVMIVCVGGTYLMRRRVGMMVATKPERTFLSMLHYYAAVGLGANAGMLFYQRTFENKVLEKIPNSCAAQLIKDRKQ